MRRALRYVPLMGLFMAASCGDKKPAPKKKSQTAPQSTSPQGQDKSKTVAPAPPKAPTLSFPDEPWTIARTPRDKLVRKLADGTRQEWLQSGGIEVSDEELYPLYASRGTHFIGFRAQVQGGKEDCVLEWRAELLDTATGRGQTVDTIQGQVPIPANSTVTVSGLAPLAPRDAAKVASATAGYWTLCGAEMKSSPSPFDIAIDSTRSEDLKLHESGPHQPIRHRVFKLRSQWKEDPQRLRCYFELVHEDVDDRGFTLNRDFAAYSMSAGSQLEAMVRRTSFEGGDATDYESMIHESRDYIRKVVCGGAFAVDPNHIDGIEFLEISLDPPAEDSTKVDDLLRQRHRHRLRVVNKMGKDCSFHLRYQLLDKANTPFSQTTPLGETLHLRKGQTANYLSSRARVGVWKEQAAELGELVVARAAPISQCSKFDASKALP